MLRGDGPPNSPAPIGPLPVMVGGSGERRLLRLVARYADMGNLSAPSGDGLATIPHKLDVLDRHCVAVGRDRREITVTYKALACVASTDAGARAAWDAYRSAHGLPPLGPEDGALVGTPERIADQAAAFLAVGIDDVIVELPNAHDADAVRLAGLALRSAADVVPA
jgi:alkanesulfonate monooxygenase SsuD/methylene tetrahydromethanopterin reductase-like flavin-dependent oxidoreductase (luciferase family)